MSFGGGPVPASQQPEGALDDQECVRSIEVVAPPMQALQVSGAQFFQQRALTTGKCYEHASTTRAISRFSRTRSVRNQPSKCRAVGAQWKRCVPDGPIVEIERCSHVASPRH
jgi:hypothetical protein